MSYTHRYWYSYKGAGFDPHAAGSWNLIPGKPHCVGIHNLCALYAYSQFRMFNPPELSANIQGYISAALAGDNNGFPTSGPKYFVYNKG